MRDMANLNLGVGLDIMSGVLGASTGSAVVGAFRETRRVVETGQKIGEHKQVLDAPGAVEEPLTADLLREAELTAELEALRERRGG